MKMAKLILKFKDTTLREFPIVKSTVIIGRTDNNDIKIDNLAVSRQHTKIWQKGDHYIVEDLGSLNGTFVNNRKVKKDILKDQDEILVGKHTLIFIDEEEKPVEVRKDVDMSSADETFVLDTKKVQELLSQQNAKKPPIDKKPPIGKKSSIEKRPSELEGSISIISGGVSQNRIKLTKRLTVGGKNGSTDIRLRGLFVGKTAFLISKGPEGFFISHSGGRRMTKVNGAAVKGRRELRDGDIIGIGATRMLFSSKASS
jgi:pSer/pThr/pTyr-binding forkhead associated (FHA) protein